MLSQIAHSAEDAILAHVAALIADHDVVVLSDYAKGVLTDRVISGTIASARAAGVPVVVDPKSRTLVRYAGATMLPPNAKEVFEATGIEVRDDASAAAAARDAMIAADVGAMLVTRSEAGMTLVESDGAVTHLGASAREVFDVVGAGDTVVATIALCLGAGMPLPAAMGVPMPPPASSSASRALRRCHASPVSHPEELAAFIEKAASEPFGAWR